MSIGPQKVPLNTPDTADRGKTHREHGPGTSQWPSEQGMDPHAVKPSDSHSRMGDLDFTPVVALVGDLHAPAPDSWSVLSTSKALLPKFQHEGAEGAESLRGVFSS